jgi:SagB-type dehydrogenase family enzyme
MDNHSAEEALRITKAYHERTKHRFSAYAAGPEFLDWDDQPSPFRSFAGTEIIRLPLSPGLPEKPYSELFDPKKKNPPPSFDLASVSLLLEVSLGLSAWKSYPGARWSLRCNPSSGNLHPTEAYLIAPDLSGLQGGVYHYLSLDHVLERRNIPGLSWNGAWQTPGVIVALTSIYWREAWKYGERAFRYCQHDVGHALAAVRFASAALGWEATILDGWNDNTISRLTGTDRHQEFPDEEREAPEVLVWIGGRSTAPDRSLLVEAIDCGRWEGEASQMSPDHRRWTVIGEVDRATRDHSTPGRPLFSPTSRPPLPDIPSGVPSGQIFRQRRSAQRFDPNAEPLPKPAFLRILEALLPREGVPPFDILTWAPRIHPLLFVYKVEGLEPGCYLLARSQEVEEALVRSLSADFSTEEVQGVPPHIPLKLLRRGDTRNFVRNLCCRQAIASQSLFAVAMLSCFEDSLKEGPWWYRRLFWEAGVLGQSLYLEAEAAGVRGTGIGCFFDDELHSWLGFSTRDFQSLYHFTVGRPISDPRLETSPPYPSA